jgi:hypothetical protein
MFERVQTGQRVAALDVLRGDGVHDIELSENDIAACRGQWTNVKHFNRSEYSDMGDEAADARSDIHMTLRLVLVNAARYQDILMEIMPAGLTALVSIFAQTGVEFAQTKIVTLKKQPSECQVVANESGKGSGRTDQFDRIDPEYPAQ